MASIRKTKKRLKREIADDELYLSMRGIFLADAVYQSIKLKKQELENLKQKEAMTDRIKLEDMTLRQIGELKCYMANDIRKAITDIVCKYNESHDCGDVDLSIDTDIREFRTECGEKFAPSDIRYDIRIKFSREDE